MRSNGAGGGSAEGPEPQDDPRRGGGRSFGRYVPGEVIGRGASGTVYLARDPLIERTVALKVLEILADLSPRQAGELRERFLREVRAAGSLDHPHLVTIYDAGAQGDHLFVAMEHVGGGNLRSWTEGRRGGSAAVLARQLNQIAGALDAAHAAGIVHRDLKPANILITEEGEAKVADFGIAKLAGARLTVQGATTTSAPSGVIFGTPAYLSPEQALGREATPASDQFALGVILYHFFTGVLPFGGDNPAAVLYRTVHHQPVRPEVLNPRLPAALADAVMRTLDKEPDGRFPDCSSFASAVSAAVGERGGRGLIVSGGEAAAGLSPGELAMTTLVEPTEGRGAAPPERAEGGAGWGRRGLWIGALALVLALAVAAGSWIALGGGDGGPAAGEDPVGAVGGRVAAGGEEGGARLPPAPGAAADSPADSPAGAAAEAPVEAAGTEAEGTAAADAEPVRFRITSRPAGAHVMLDGVPSSIVTPVTLALRPGVRHLLTVSREGYETVEWSFTLAELTQQQRHSRVLHFPLSPKLEPAPREGPKGRPLLAPGRVPVPAKVHHVDAVYPQRLRRQGVEGYVIARVQIDTEGRVANAEVLKGLHRDLDRAALDAVRDWRYEPTLRNGEPVWVETSVTVFFPPR